MRKISNKQEKPNYGYVALKPFLIIGILGIIALISIYFCINISGFWGYFSTIICSVIAFVGIYVSLSYIPLYNKLLKPREDDNFWQNLLTKERIKKNSKALDIGCGTGQVTISVSKYLNSGHITGIDIYKGMSGKSPDIAIKNAKIEGVSDRVEFKNGNLLEIPFPDNTFDLVTAGSVLHEIEGDNNKLKALNEIYRVLKPNGKFITIEIIKDIRLFFAVLIFVFVWKTDHYWKSLFKRSKFPTINSDYEIKLVKLGNYILIKN